MGRLDDKVVLITGTAGGQGRAAAMLFAAQGAKVVGCDIKERELTETADLITAEGGTYHGQLCDIADETQFRQLVAFTTETYGPIDVLYNNGGAAQFAPIWEMTREMWDFTMRNELDVIFIACREIVSQMMERRRGCIINTASVAGMVGMEMRGAPEPYPAGRRCSLRRQGRRHCHDPRTCTGTRALRDPGEQYCAGFDHHPGISRTP